MALKGFDRVQKSIKKGFDQALAVTNAGAPRDADVRFYEQLSPEAFDVIAATYGPDNLVNYITAMEARRMKNGSNLH